MAAEKEDIKEAIDERLLWLGARVQVNLKIKPDRWKKVAVSPELKYVTDKCDLT